MALLFSRSTIDPVLPVRAMLQEGRMFQTATDTTPAPVPADDQPSPEIIIEILEQIEQSLSPS